MLARCGIETRAVAAPVSNSVALISDDSILTHKFIDGLNEGGSWKSVGVTIAHALTYCFGVSAGSWVTSSLEQELV